MPTTATNRQGSPWPDVRVPIPKRYRPHGDAEPVRGAGGDCG